MTAAAKSAAAGPAEEECVADQVQEMRTALLTWYQAHKRDLPWRATRDPYRIWVSEIMLQQTRVAAVLEHYRLFLAAFPTIQVLAAASEAEVLALWSGLGYYRRARMLHRGGGGEYRVRRARGRGGWQRGARAGTARRMVRHGDGICNACGYICGNA